MNSLTNPHLIVLCLEKPELIPVKFKTDKIASDFLVLLYERRQVWVLFGPYELAVSSIQLEVQRRHKGGGRSVHNVILYLHPKNAQK